MEIKPLIDKVIVKDKSIKVQAHRNLYDKYLLEDFYVEYGKDIGLRNIDESILLIPFILNIAPIIWISGDKYSLKKMDKQLNASLIELKEVFKELYPNVYWNGDIIPEEVVENKSSNYSSEEIDAGVLFSGGVDSLCTSFRNYNRKQLLISICGNDIDFNNDSGWLKVEKINEKFAQTYGHKYTSIKSNFRSFINNLKMDRMDPEIYNWWAKVQHGMGLIGLTAPLLEFKGIDTLFISSTKTIENLVPWGSLKNIDENAKWGKITVIHDGFELNRQNKIKEIISACEKYNLKKPIFRVCYERPLGDGDNCCKCEKCLRTITGLMIESQNIQDYGFNIEESEVKRLVINNFNQYKIRVNEDLEYVWSTLQKSIKQRDLEALDGDVYNYFVWLKELDLNRYIQEYKKKRKLIDFLKKLIKSNVLIYKLSKKAKLLLLKNN